MRTILVAKGGSVFRTRDGAGNAVGEQGETEGLIRHLVARGDVNVVYFGQYRGEELCRVYQPHVKGLSEWSTEKEQWERFREDAAFLDTLEEPLCFIQSAGYAPTFSTIDNPRGAQVQSAAILYTAPMLHAIEYLKLPRIVVNNDPRTYPRDQEMSYGWDYCRPVALLDQWDHDQPQTVGGKKYLRRSVHARCESWAYTPRTAHQDAYACNVIAHAHLADGTRNGSQEAWDIVLHGERCDVYGSGWEHWHNGPAYAGRLWNKISPAAVSALLSQTMCCPVVSHTPGFYTGKPYVLEAHGCIPLLFGNGDHSHTYDPKGILQPLDSPMRIVLPGDLTRLILYLEALSEPQLSGIREAWRVACQPDWSRLDDLINDLLDGADVNSNDWRVRYGGYIPWN